MLYIDDKLPRHPKIMKAGALLGGGDGPALALAMVVAGLAYAREYVTDGTLPDAFVERSMLVRAPFDVASSLVRAKLWHRIRGGYRIHDFHDWNKSAAEIKETRAKWRDKKAKQRRGGNGQYVAPEESPGDSHQDSRARVRSTTTTTTTKGDSTQGTGTCTVSVLTVASRRNFPQGQEKTPTFKQLLAMAHAEYREPLDEGEWAERIKVRLAWQHFDYPLPHEISAAMRAVAHVRRTA